MKTKLRYYFNLQWLRWQVFKVTATRFLKVWVELKMAPFIVLFYVVGSVLIRLADPAAGLFDTGVWQTIMWGSVQLLAVSFFGWLFLNYQFPGVFRYLCREFEDDFKNLTKWEKQRISLGLLALYLLVAALAMLLI